MKKIIIASFLLLVSFFVQGQEMVGLISGNHHVNYSSTINPSALHNSKNYLEFNLVGFSANLDIQNLNFDLKNFPPSELISGNTNKYVLDYISLDTNKKVDMYQNARIILPGISYIHNRHAFSLNSSVREHFYIKGMSGEITVFMMNEGLSYKPYHNKLLQNERIEISALLWNEIRLGYSYMIKQERHQRIAVGINLKRLYGGTNFNIRFTNLDFTPIDNGTLSVHNMNMDIESSLFFDPSTNNFNNSDPLIKGKGWGFDLGITYYYSEKGFKKNHNKQACKIPYQEYDYRIGFSVIDIGAIKFNNNAWKTSDFNNGNSTWYHLNNFQFNGMNNMIDSLNTHIFNNQGTLSAESYNALLPAALSVQFDLRFQKNFYLNTTWIHGFRYQKNVPVRPAVIALTPRFEKNHLELAFPLLMYDYRSPRAGFFVRYRFLSIGTDRLGMFFNKQEFDGFDVYASLTFRLQKGKCGLFSKKKKLCEAYDSGKTRHSKKRKNW
ncbi:MAG: hypothetical protein JEZ03_04360 [Bacteroidales bacterium]|nr:hypothetical protein [Bacteroidales bacterium]